MKVDNPIYEEQKQEPNEQHEGSFSLVWRPLVARFFPDTEMIYWVPEYMDTLRSRKKGKEQEDNDNDGHDCDFHRTTHQDKVDLNSNYDKKYSDEQLKQNHDQSPTEQVLSPLSKKLSMLSPLSNISNLLSPKSTKSLNNSGSCRLICESPESQKITLSFSPEYTNASGSPESQKITITFSPESVKSYAFTNDEPKHSNFQSPAVAAHNIYTASPHIYHFDKTHTERNSINLFGHRFNLSRQHRAVSEVTDDFIFHRPNARVETNTNSPSYINPIELQHINHRQSGDPLPTPPRSLWEPYGNSGHIYMNDTKVLKNRIPEPKDLNGFLTSSVEQNLYSDSGHIYMNDTKILKHRIPEAKDLNGFLTSSVEQNLYSNSGYIYINDTQVLKGQMPEPKLVDGFLTSSIEHNLHRNVDYEPLGMKVLPTNSSNSTIQQATEESDMYHLHICLYSCMVLLILLLGFVLILVILRVPVF